MLCVQLSEFSQMDVSVPRPPSLLLTASPGGDHLEDTSHTVSFIGALT